MQDILVSIFCLTYNHAEYLKDAMEGFLRQRTSFPFEICIFDDASTDATREIILEYEKMSALPFQICFAEKNLFGTPLWQKKIDDLIKKCKGKYIAYCEGDDYWTSPEKLEFQVSFMENNPRYVMTAHNAVWMDCRTGEERTYSRYLGDQKIDGEKVVENGSGCLATASLVVRKSVAVRSDEFPVCDVGDWPLQLYAITKGEVFYFDRKMAVYRYMHSGSWSNMTGGDYKRNMRHRICMLDFLEKYDEYTKHQYHDSVTKQIDMYYYANVYDQFPGMSEEEYERILTNLVQKDGFAEPLIRQMVEMRKMLRIHGYLNGELLKRCEENKKIYIFGMGRYAEIIKEGLDLHQIDIEGFVVSNMSDMEKKEKGMKVYSLNDFIKLEGEPFVIIALHDRWRAEVEPMLEEADLHNFYAPFWRA